MLHRDNFDWGDTTFSGMPGAQVESGSSLEFQDGAILYVDEIEETTSGTGVTIDSSYDGAGNPQNDPGVLIRDGGVRFENRISGSNVTPRDNFLEYYENGSFIVDWLDQPGGATEQPDYEIPFQRIGNTVTLYLESSLAGSIGTVNGQPVATTAIPTRLRPNSDVSHTCFIYGLNGSANRTLGILDIKTIEQGIQHELSPTPPAIEFINNSIVTGVTGTFSTSESVTGATSGFTAEVNSFDSARGLLKLDAVVGSPVVGEIINGATSGASGKLHITDHASATVNVVAIADTDGEFLNEEGWLSENTMKVQDSLLYQDYSYIIRVGRSINEWRDAYVKTLHSAGFYFQGEIAIQSTLNAQIRRITGVNSGVEGILKTMLTRIYSKLVGRRLGTETDGTSLRANANEVVSADFDTDTISQFSKTTRDVTLKTQPLVIDYVSRVRRTINNVNVRQGFVYAGPRFGTINKMIQTAFGATANPSGAQGTSGITFAVLSGIKVQGTRTSLDGQNAIFLMTSNEDGRKIKTNFTIPTEVSRIIFGSNSFDEDATSFDSSSITFDVE